MATHPTALDRLLPDARLAEVDFVDVAGPPETVWEHVRHENLATSPLIRALFAIRSIPSRLRGERDEDMLTIDEMVSTPEKPGFQLMIDDPPRELVVAAIGKVWQGTIPFVFTASAAEYAAFNEPDFVKVAWAIRVLPRGGRDARVEIEVRVDATDDAAWEKFVRYFRFIGIGSHFIRHELLRSVAHRFGAPDDDTRHLAGDDLLPDARGQFTHCIDIHAKPDAIWLWLLQMGCNRAGYYSYDVLDNGGHRSARELHREWLNLAVGDVIPATPDGPDGFEVLRLDAPHTFILGGLYDNELRKQIRFVSPRPRDFWQVTWAFVLEALDDDTTRLHVRARGAFSATGRLHAAYIQPVHWFMETAQLRNLKRRAEGTLPRDDARDVLEGIGGAFQMLGVLVTPFLNRRRATWGCDEATANATLPGDEHVPAPGLSWTHAIEIAAPAEQVWPWVAQIGADRGGFYSYQWLENLVGCGVRNAETVHPEWELRVGDQLVLHPKTPPLTVVEVARGKHLVAAAADDHTRGMWAFVLQPIDERRCRLISRFRASFDDDLGQRLAFGITEPIGFVMDRRMLRGIRERAEATR